MINEAYLKMLDTFKVLHIRVSLNCTADEMAKVQLTAETNIGITTHNAGYKVTPHSRDRCALSSNDSDRKSFPYPKRMRASNPKITGPLTRIERITRLLPTVVIAAL
jgi:hypothetical protein